MRDDDGLAQAGGHGGSGKGRESGYFGNIAPDRYEKSLFHAKYFLITSLGNSQGASLFTKMTSEQLEQS